MAAKIATTPETSDYTSIKQRVEHVQAQGKTAELEAAKGGSVAGSRAAGGLEEALWLCPIEERRGLDSTREGMIQGFPMGSYVKLVDYTGRLFRRRKASISAELAGIFERLGCSVQSWQARLEKLKGGPAVRPILRNHSREAARNQRALGRTVRVQPGGLSGPMTRS